MAYIHVVRWVRATRGRLQCEIPGGRKVTYSLTQRQKVMDCSTYRRLWVEKSRALEKYHTRNIQGPLLGAHETHILAKHTRFCA